MLAEAIMQVREIRNLGSTVKKVSNLNNTGYEISYVNGDICDFDNSTRYNSSVKAICDPESVGFGT